MVDDPRVRVVFLPRPRRSRHPYQWGCAAGLLVYALANIIVGPASHSPLLIVGNRDNEWLNYFLLFGAVNLLVATVIPDNYWRLFVELFGTCRWYSAQACSASSPAKAFSWSPPDPTSKTVCR